MRAIVIGTVVAATATSLAAADRALVVPQVGAAIHCDGELDEVAWRSPARTGPFLDPKGETAAPYSEARFLRDDANLYIALYAADEDIRSSDEFIVQVGSGSSQMTLHFTAAGKLVPAIAGAKVGVDLDGNLDDASNDDEEWVIEASIPLAALPFGRDGTLQAR